MTPESSEGRERIVRLEGSIEDLERQVERNERTFGPLPLAVERLQWTIDAINTRLDKRDKQDDERFEKLARSFENQVIACKGAVDGVATEQKRQSEVFLEWQEKERQRREVARKEREALEREAKQTQTQKAIAKYGPTATLVAALLAFLGVIFQSLFGGG